MYTVIIPCYNEEKTIRGVVKIASSARNVGQVIVINDGSSDRSAERASGISPHVEVISHQRNMGKGAAVRTGVAHSKYENIVFIDADLTNLTGDMIYNLVEPLLNKQADFVKASFSRARGRVTEIAVKPMMQILFPDTYFEQPISGQFAGKASFFKSIKIIDDWGLDIGILLDAISQKLRIVEVNIGELEHKAQSEQSLARMSEQVLRTMIQKAGLFSNKYQLILFSFDESILKNYSMQSLMRYFGKLEEYNLLARQFADESILPLEYYQGLAGLMAGISIDEMQNYANSLELRTYAKDVIYHLQRRHYKVGIIGMHFKPIMEAIAARLDISVIEGIELPRAGKKYAGRMSRRSTLAWFEGMIEEGYEAAMNRAVSAVNTTAENTIVVASTEEAVPMLERAGLGIGYRTRGKSVRMAANKSISILPEILVIVE